MNRIIRNRFLTEQEAAEDELIRQQIRQEFLPSMTSAAEAAYTAYCESCGGKSFRGEPLPSWQQLQQSTDEAHQKLVKHWEAAAKAAISFENHNRAGDA